MKSCIDCEHCVTRLDVYHKKPQFMLCFRNAHITSDINLVTGREFLKITGPYRSCYVERYSNTSFGLCSKSGEYFKERVNKNSLGVLPIDHIMLIDNNDDIMNIGLQEL